MIERGSSSKWVRGVLLASAHGCVLLAHAQCPGLKPRFEWTSNGSSMVFTDLTPEWQVTARLWEFGDGDTASDVTATHSYALAGADMVRLTVHSLGCPYQSEAFVFHGGPSDSCYSQISSTFATTQISNNALAVTDASQGDGSPLLYFWNFGDDSISLDTSLTHFYALPGAYDVTHSITTLDSQTVCFAGSAQRVFVDGNTSTCDSSVFFDLSGAFAGNTISLNANTIALDEGLVFLQWEWDYGDQSADVSVAPGIEHIYTYPGEYQVCVTVHVADTASNDSCWARACSTLTTEAVGVQEEDASSLLRARPVPCNDELWIEGPMLRAGARVLLMDALGREVLARTVQTSGTIRLETRALPSGFYTAVIQHDRRTNSLRLLKQ